MDVQKHDPNIWRIIIRQLPVVTAAYLASTCRWLYNHFNHDPYISKWRSAYKLSAGCGTSHRKCKCGIRGFNDSFIEAAAAGDMSLVRVFEQRANRKGWALYKAVRHGHEEVAQYLMSSELPLLRDYDTMGVVHVRENAFISHGNMVRFEKLSLDNVPSYIINEASRNGDSEAIADAPFLNARFCNDLLAPIRIALINDRLEVIKWIASSLCMRHIMHHMMYAGPNITAWWESISQSPCSCDICIRQFKHKSTYVCDSDFYYNSMKWYDNIEVLLYVDAEIPTGFVNLSAAQKFSMAERALSFSRFDILVWMRRNGILRRLMTLKRILKRRGSVKEWGFLRDLQDGKIK